MVEAGYYDTLMILCYSVYVIRLGKNIFIRIGVDSSNNSVCLCPTGNNFPLLMASIPSIAQKPVLYLLWRQEFSGIRDIFIRCGEQECWLMTKQCLDPRTWNDFLASWKVSLVSQASRNEDIRQMSSGGEGEGALGISQAALFQNLVEQGQYLLRPKWT